MAKLRAVPALHAASKHVGPEITVALSKIDAIDPCNCRRADPRDIKGLAADIAENGQIYPLIVRDGPRGYLVLEGSRRFQAMHVLTPTPADAHRFDVRVCVFTGTDAEARALSLSGNFEREDLHPLDEAEAFAALGLTPREIAVAHGLSTRRVNELLALAALSPRVKALWRAGEIGLPAAQAFAAEPRIAVQDALLDAPDWLSLRTAPAEIRARLTRGAVPASDPRAIFVGAEDFVEQGGEVIADLFGAAPMFSDETLLDALVAAKIAYRADEIRVAESWGFVLTPDEFRSSGQVEQDFLDSEISATQRLGDALEAPGLPAHEAATLQAEIDLIERVAALRAIAKAERHRYGVHLWLDLDGRLVVERGLNRSPDRLPPTGSDRVDGPSSVGGGTPAEEAASPHANPSPVTREKVREAGMRFRPAPDAPLAPAARRLAETAASRALAAPVAITGTVHAMALMVACMATAGRHRGPVRIEREQGPWSAKSPLALGFAKLSFPKSLARARSLAGEDLCDVFAELVAASIDLRGADRDDAEAIIADLTAIDPLLPGRIAAELDYRAFFREASRATALLVIRETGGDAEELRYSGRADDELREQAELMARARSWVPEFLRGEGK